MERRAFFSICFLALFTSGCIGQNNSVLTDLDIINVSGEELSVGVEFFTGGEKIFNSTYTVAPDTLAGETDLDVGKEFQVVATINNENQIMKEYSVDTECTDNGVTILIENVSSAEIYADNC